MGAQKKVSDVMTREVVTLYEEDNLHTILDGLERYRFRHVPVIDGTKVVGIVSQNDTMAAMASRLDRSSVAATRETNLEENTFIQSIMTPNPRTIGPDVSIKEAAGVIAEDRIGALPVVDGDGNILGIVTEYDLLRALALS